MIMAVASALWIPQCSRLATSHSKLAVSTTALAEASTTLGLRRLHGGRARGIDCNLSVGRASIPLPRAIAVAAEEAPPKADLAELKAELLAAVAGLDRGLVATKADEERADSIAFKLEAAADPVLLPQDLDRLQGRWRLVFSSGFNTGSFGGQRPGPNITRLPLVSIGLVHQRIDVPNRELDNIVDLNFPTPWPLPPIQLTASLVHSFELLGGSTIRIIFEKTTVTPEGQLSSVPPFELPRIRLPDFLQTTARNNSAGEFSTTFLDRDVRISRGDRGELRIFVRS